MFLSHAELEECSGSAALCSVVQRGLKATAGIWFLQRKKTAGGKKKKQKNKKLPQAM